MDPLDDGVEVTLCDECSTTLIEKNWLGAMVLKDSFSCMLCRGVFCRHLKADDQAAMCKPCAEE